MLLPIPTQEIPLSTTQGRGRSNSRCTRGPPRHWQRRARRPPGSWPAGPAPRSIAAPRLPTRAPAGGSRCHPRTKRLLQLPGSGPPRSRVAAAAAHPPRIAVRTPLLQHHAFPRLAAFVGAQPFQVETGLCPLLAPRAQRCLKDMIGGQILAQFRHGGGCQDQRGSRFEGAVHNGAPSLMYPLQGSSGEASLQY